MMKALIVEDEPMARMRLVKLLEASFPNVEVVAQTDSITGTLDYLRCSGDPDIIFMDVELSDGDCFEIFRQRDVRSKVIMTTAYDSYAVKAFEAGSIDYLLKPVSVSALQRALGRCETAVAAAGSAGGAVGSADGGSAGSAAENSTDAGRIMASVSGAKKWKKRILVRVGEQYVPLELASIACFLSEDKCNYVYMTSGGRYLLDLTMDKICEGLDPESFFRVSRSCIVRREAVKTVLRHLNGRLKLELSVRTPEELFVSRSRVDDFLAWLE